MCEREISIENVGYVAMQVGGGVEEGVSTWNTALNSVSSSCRFFSLSARLIWIVISKAYASAFLLLSRSGSSRGVDSWPSTRDSAPLPAVRGMPAKGGREREGDGRVREM